MKARQWTLFSSMERGQVVSGRMPLMNSCCANCLAVEKGRLEKQRGAAAWRRWGGRAEEMSGGKENSASTSEAEAARTARLLKSLGKAMAKLSKKKVFKRLGSDSGMGKSVSQMTTERLGFD